MYVFTPNTVIRSTEVNQNFDELQTWQDTTDAAWTTWSPDVTNITETSGTTLAAYKQVGKTVHCRWHFKFGASSAISGVPNIPLPVTAHSDYSTARFHPIGSADFHDSGTNIVLGTVFIEQSTTNAIIYHWLASGTYVTYQAPSATVPFTFTTNDTIAATFAYEAA